MVIYYEYEPQIGINVSYHYNGEQHYDFFSSMFTFKAWLACEFHGAQTVEVTDSNYQDLVSQGKW